MNIIHAEERFCDKAFMDSITFKLWQYDRYWLGLDVQTCANFHDAAAMRCNEPPLTIAMIERLERLYTAWLVRRGDEASDRR